MKKEYSHSSFLILFLKISLRYEYWNKAPEILGINEKVKKSA